MSYYDWHNWVPKKEPLIQPQAGMWTVYHNGLNESHKFMVDIFIDLENAIHGNDVLHNFTIRGNFDPKSLKVSFQKDDKYFSVEPSYYKGTMTPDGTTIKGKYTVKGSTDTFTMTCKEEPYKPAEYDDEFIKSLMADQNA